MQKAIKYVFYKPDVQLLHTLEQAQVIEPKITLTTKDSELNDFGFYRLLPTEIPQAGRYQQINEITPIYRDGNYYRQYEVIDLFTQEIETRPGQFRSIEQQKSDYDKMLLTMAIRKRLNDLQTDFESRLEQMYTFEFEGLVVVFKPTSQTVVTCSCYLSLAQTAKQVYLPCENFVCFTAEQAAQYCKHVLELHSKLSDEYYAARYLVGMCTSLEELETLS